MAWNNINFLFCAKTLRYVKRILLQNGLNYNLLACVSAMYSSLLIILCHVVLSSHKEMKRLWTFSISLFVKTCNTEHIRYLEKLKKKMFVNCIEYYNSIIKHMFAKWFSIFLLYFFTKCRFCHFNWNVLKSFLIFRPQISYLLP